MTDNHQMTDAQQLLLNARVLYEKYEAGRPKSFNVFSVLALEHKEAELHSRFLAALLDHKETDDIDAKRKNLADFLERIGIKDFKQDSDDNIRVERERSNIDILITNDDSKQAIIIENKIDAEDSPQQLERYWNTMKKRDWDVWLVYLSLNERAPSKKSLDDTHEAKTGGKLKCISYRDHVADWLLGCKQRAHANPELRESIAQYLQTVKNITGTNHNDSEMYIDKLSAYLLDNPTGLALARDLANAFDEAMIDLQRRLWKRIEGEVARSIDPRFKNTAVTWSEDKKVESWYIGGKQRNYERWYGVHFSLGGDVSWEMGVEMAYNSPESNTTTYDGLFYGISVDKDRYDELHDVYVKNNSPTWLGDKVFNEINRRETKGDIDIDRYWPCCNVFHKIDLRHPSREQLRHIAKKGVPDFLQECVDEIVDGLQQMWDAINNDGMIRV